MRIALAYSSNRQFGGTGSYLRAIVPYLHQAGHQTAFFHEHDGPAGCEPIALPSGTPSWNVGALGRDSALMALTDWRPDVIFAHGLREPATESRVLDLAPAVFFAHDYNGTCISGAKAFGWPVIQPCDRTFGWPCLVHYFPRRCGGRSPITMVREFRRQSSRLDLLRRYRAVVTHSTRMEEEYKRHGIHVSRVFRVEPGEPCERQSGPKSLPDSHDDVWRLLFLGRLHRLKGGRELIKALPDVAARLGRGVRLIVAGDGPQREDWQALAARVMSSHPSVHVEFHGWIGTEAVDRLLVRAHLLVLPSLWPEPFGLVGVEAGRHGVPVAAYAVGGIPDWLHAGVNGFLAPGDPPTVDGLTHAIVSCLHDPVRYLRLREGASRFSADEMFARHAATMLSVLEVAVGVSRS